MKTRRNPTLYRVDVKKRAGADMAVLFNSLSLAKDFFALHTDDKHDLVELKEEHGGAWVVIESFSHGW